MPDVDFKKCSLIIPTTFTLAAYVVTLDNSLFSMSFATPKILNCLLAVVTLAVFESISTLDTKFGEAPAAYTISVFNPISAIARFHPLVLRIFHMGRQIRIQRYP
jgi:hypothetical protein